MEQRSENARMREIAERLIATEPLLAHLRGSSVLIGYLVSDKERTSRGRTVYGECEKVPDKYRWAVPYDFTVTVYWPNASRFDDRRMEALLIHELLHIGIEVDGNEERYSIVPHDVEDFRAIIDRYGLDWHAEDRQTASP